MLTPQRFEKAADIFHRAIELPKESRHAFLDSWCHNDLELRREVEGLLASSDDGGDEFCESRLGLGMASMRGALEEVASGLPASIGGYRVTRLVGEGGMGRVYEAWQERPSRRVAVKVMRPEYDSIQVTRRFDLEAEILGTLRHPSIAQIIQAGTFEQYGRERRFFAMEFVEGQTLKAHAHARSLDVRGRMELLARVCDGVEHAHSQGIVHRDLKPSNILVCDDGSLKILDFGIARHVAAVNPEFSMQTLTGQVMGTLSYMSPEQMAGRHAQIDARADVYSLGVIAYELLIDRLPHDLHDIPLAEAARRIADVEPARLGTIDRRLAGDVDAMVGKCLEKDPAARYATAAEFATDIRAFLADEPVRARVPSAAYQLRKFVRRKPALATSLLVTVLALVAGTVVASLQAFKANRELARATEVKRVVSDMITSIRVDEASGLDTQLMLKILNRTAERLNAEGAADVLIEAELRQMLGKTYRIVGDIPRSLAMLERAVAIRTDRLGADSPETLESLHELGHLFLDSGQAAEAEVAIRGAMEGRRRILGEDDPLTLESISNYGGVLELQGRMAEAESHYRRVLDTQLRTIGAQDRRTLSTKVILGMCLQIEGRNDQDQGKADEARRKKEEALRLHLEGLEGLKSTLGSDHPETLRTMTRMAMLQRENGKLADAEQTLLATLDAERRVYGSAHSETLLTLSMLALVHEDQRKVPEAEAEFREVLAGRRRRGEDSFATLLAISNLANFLRDHNNLAESQSLLVELVERSRRVHGNDRSETLWALSNLGGVLNRQNRPAEAEPLMREAFERGIRVFGDQDTVALTWMFRLAGVLHKLDRNQDAARLLETWNAKVRQAWEGKNDTQYGQYLSELGESQKRAGRFTQAESILSEARAVLVRGFGERNFYTRTCTARLAELYEAWDRSEPGSGKLEKAAGMRQLIENASAPK